MTPNATHKHLFYSEMAKLLEAGFDIRKAAAVLMDTQLPAQQAALLKDLNHGLESGETIATAFGKDTKSISGLERSIIGAGERGGKLAPAFQHLADYFGMLASARREMIQGMIYPIIILHLGVIIGTIPMALMQATQTPAQMLGSLVVNLIVLYVAAFVLFMVIRAVLKMAPDKPGIDRLINRIPWIGNTRRNLAMARFCRVYHSCVLAGIPMSETAAIAAEASQSALIRIAGKRLAQVAKEGNALGPQFVAEGAFPKAFARSYMTGEEAGTLDKDLGRWSKVFQDNAESAAKTMGVMVPKVLYFFIMMFVAWKIVSFFTGYYSGMEHMME
ncbi:MAG: type II secretion system F family protein [Luteolibacter sp.]|uniref:type II secretion system F family protein n=1 Tax=Luteolibacter sp. TaxID=1962973 RepID=UPI0032675B32